MKRLSLRIKAIWIFLCIFCLVFSFFVWFDVHIYLFKGNNYCHIFFWIFGVIISISFLILSCIICFRNKSRTVLKRTLWIIGMFYLQPIVATIFPVITLINEHKLSIKSANNAMNNK